MTLRFLRKYVLTLFGIGCLVITYQTAYAQSPLSGDANNDGKVNEDDYPFWLNNYGGSGGSFSVGDFNLDNNTDGVDYVIWLTHYGSVAPTPTPILPTPTLLPPPSPTPTANGSVKAFPGAEGFGTDTPGGRGGRVIYVTNLNGSGPGSLREAVEASGPRTILFKVSGTINLTDDIIVAHPYITIAGQSAPGQGVQLRGGMIKITTTDVVIRYLKIRPGDEIDSSNNSDRDAASLSGGSHYVNNIVIDHCDLIWGPDIGGTAILVDTNHSTISNSIIGEGLLFSNHSEGTPPNGHSYGASVFQLLGRTDWPTYITLHHNLYIRSNHRNPAITGAEHIDFANNVVYNFGEKAGHGSPRSLNLVNNLYLKGPLSTASYMWEPQNLHITVPANSVYESGNMADGLKLRGPCNNCYATNRFAPFSLTSLDTPQAAYDKIVAQVGANKQIADSAGVFRFVRDSVDTRIINELTSRSGNFFWNGVNQTNNRISWPALTAGIPLIDMDNDGMADTWEIQHFGSLTRGSPSNSAGDYDKDGYTDLEEFLNETDPKVW